MHVDRGHQQVRQRYHLQLRYEVHPLQLQQPVFRTLVLQVRQDQNFQSS